MGDSQQDVKKRVGYEQWTKEESNVLLQIMVDAANRGWRDNSGVFTKQTVEERILPLLNSKLGCNKKYNNYQSRLKWFKNRWVTYSTLLRFNRGFGFDSTSKRFTAPNEVWDEYLKAHPKNGNLRNGIFDDFEDLEIAIGNGVAVGKNSIGLDSLTDARTLEAGELRDIRIEEFNYDVDNKGFVGLEENDSSMGSLKVHELPKKKNSRKRGRTEYEGSSNSSENTPKRVILEQLTKLTTILERVYDLLEKRENERTFTTWDAIKEVPNLDEDIRLAAFNLIDTQIKKDGFLKMTPQEREKWIFNMIHK